MNSSRITNMGKQNAMLFSPTLPLFTTVRIQMSLKISKMIVVLKLWSLPVTRSFCCLICSFSNRCCKRAWWLLFGFPSKATWGWVEDGGMLPPYCPAKATPCLSVWVSPFCFSLNDDEACQKNNDTGNCFSLTWPFISPLVWLYGLTVCFLNAEKIVKIPLLHFDSEMKREGEQAC